MSHLILQRVTGFLEGNPTSKCAITAMAALLLLVTPKSNAQLSYGTAGTSHTENFDGVLITVPANNTVQSTPSLPQGWSFVETGTNANTSYRVHNGTVSTGDTVLLGETSSTERALGGFASGSNITQFGLALTNDTGVTLTEVTVSYNGEQWKDGNSGQSVRNTLSFAYGIGNASLTSGTFTAVTALDLVAPISGSSTGDVALDGNAPANRVTPSATISGIAWAPGETLWLRWSDANEPGNDDALGVDNFSFSAIAGGPGTLALSASTYTVSEGAGTATLTVNRTGGSGGTVTVDYTTANGTAIQPGDYTATTGTLSFGPGETSKTITVPITEDIMAEGDEAFVVDIANPTGGATLGSLVSAAVTIQDNDNGGVLQFSTANYDVSEAAGNATITVTRSVGTAGAVSVNYTTANGTAVEPGDYTAASGVLNFADGEASKTFTVAVINDTAVEVAETVSLTLSNPVGGTLGGQSSATLTIASDDAPFVVLNEVKINPPANDEPFEYIEIRGTAGAPLDGIYVVSVEGDRVSGTATTAGLADVVFNLSGQTLGTNGLLVIKAASGGHVPAPGTTVVTSSALDGSILENGTNSFAVIHSPAVPIAQGSDYDANEDGTLELPLGAVLLDVIGWADPDPFDVVPGGIVLTQLSGTPDAATRFPSDDTPLSVAAWYNGDLGGALNSSLDYDIAVTSTNFPTGGVLTPGDLNAPKTGGVLAFAAASYTSNESAGQAVLTVNRTGGSLGTVTVDYATANGTAATPGDYAATSGTLTFLENELSKTITVLINDDGTPESIEDFALVLSNPTGTGASLGTPATATVSIQDSAGTLQLSSVSYNASEGGGSAVITVTRTNGTTGSVSVDYATSAGTATAGDDYTQTAGTLTLGNGVTSATFNVPLLNDATIEPAETVNLALSNPVGGAVLGTPGNATLLITDDDAQFVRLNEVKVNPPTSADQPNEFIEIKGMPSATLSKIYVVSMDGNTGLNLGKADLVFDLDGQVLGTSGLLLIKAANGGPDSQPDVTVVTSTALDTGSLQSLDNDSNSFLVVYSPTNPLVTGTDYDSGDDGVLDLPVGAVVLDAVGWKDGGALDVVYGGVTLAQSSGTPDAATRFPVNDAAFSAAAWYNGDLLFGSADPAELAYDINPAFLSANFPIGGLLTPGDANAPKPGRFVMASSSYTVDEGAAIITVTVQRLGGLTGAVSIDYATANGTALQPADYTAATGTLNFADGETSQTLDLLVVDDATIELGETFSFALSSPGGGATLGAPASAAITITDNDGAGLVTLDQSNYSVSEGAGMLTVTVNRFGGTGAPFAVSYATSAGTATAGIDYTQTSGTLNFAQDETSKTFDVPVTSDTLSESSETFIITLSNPTNSAALGTPSAATASIVSDDAPALVLNEIKVNPPGNDNPFEYIEVRGTPGETLPPGTMLVIFEGDSGTTQGFADVVIDLGGQTLGSNGMLVMKSGTGGHVMPPETTVVTDPLFDLAGGGLENGTGAFSLWFSPAGAFAEVTDYDVNNDGTLEPPGGAILLDVVGFSDGGATDIVHGGVVLTQSSGTPDAATRFPGDATPMSLAAWYNGDLDTVANLPAELAYDAAKASANYPADGLLTPGQPNAGTPPPPVEIAVFNGAAITDPELADGQAAVIAFGSTPVGTPVTRSFTIKNTGTAPLAITGITVPVGFTALNAPASVAAAGTATFQVRFEAMTAGTASGEVVIGNDDVDENPFNFSVSATATPPLSHQQNWRQTHFGSGANSGAGADNADPDNDGIANLLEYALGFNPTTPTSAALLPQAALSGGNLVMQVTQPVGVTGITYSAEVSSTLLPGSWSPVTGSFVAPVHTFSQAVGTDAWLFMRLVITNITD